MMTTLWPVACNFVASDHASPFREVLCDHATQGPRSIPAGHEAAGTVAFGDKYSRECAGWHPWSSVEAALAELAERLESYPHETRRANIPDRTIELALLDLDVTFSGPASRRPTHRHRTGHRPKPHSPDDERQVTTSSNSPTSACTSRTPATGRLHPRRQPAGPYCACGICSGRCSRLACVTCLTGRRAELPTRRSVSRAMTGQEPKVRCHQRSATPPATRSTGLAESTLVNTSQNPSQPHVLPRYRASSRSPITSGRWHRRASAAVSMIASWFAGDDRSLCRSPQRPLPRASCCPGDPTSGRHRHVGAGGDPRNVTRQRQEASARSLPCQTPESNRRLPASASSAAGPPVNPCALTARSRAHRRR